MNEEQLKHETKITDIILPEETEQLKEKNASLEKELENYKRWYDMVCSENRRLEKIIHDALVSKK